MTERELLLMHAARYPKAEPTDLLKLVYQAAYGPGHLVSELSRVTAFVAEEMRTAPSVPQLTEPVGGGYVRLYLGPARERGISPEEIARRFISAAKQTPDPARFDSMLAALVALTEQGVFSFTAGTLTEAVSRWETAGKPLFRHSETYRAAYHPAYRLVLEEPCS